MTAPRELRGAGREPRARLQSVLNGFAASPARPEGYSFTPWPWEVAEPSQPPTLTIREALLVGAGPCLTRWELIENQWQPEARADGLDTLLHFRLESCDRLDAMAELCCSAGSPKALISCLDVLLAAAGDVVAPARAERVLKNIRAEASGPGDSDSDAEQLILEVLTETLDPDHLAAAQAAQRGVLRVASALGVGPRQEIRRWQEEVLLLGTPWRPAPPDLTPLINPLLARREE